MNEKKYLDKVLKSERQQVALLLANPHFQEAVAQARRAWDIPENGLLTIEDWQVWQNDFNQKDALHGVSRLEVSQKIRDLKKREDAESLSEALKLQDEFNANVPVNAFRNQIEQILVELNLPPDAYEPVRGYIVRGTMSSLHGSLGVVVEEKIDLKTGRAEILLRINETTTMRDVQQVWKNVKSLQKNLKYRRRERQRAMPQLNRNLKAVELQKKGMKLDDIAKETGIGSYEDAGKEISRTKKKIGL
jgi:hypothetical protein